jgi:hypothetical protein
VFKRGQKYLGNISASNSITQRKRKWALRNLEHVLPTGPVQQNACSDNRIIQTARTDLVEREALSDETAVETLDDPRNQWPTTPRTSKLRLL